MKEQVVFSSYFERGLNLPTGDFFRSLLYYYKVSWYISSPTPSL
jgi:hypothetical protein